MLHCWHPDHMLRRAAPALGDKVECCHCGMLAYYVLGEDQHSCKGRPLTITAAVIRALQEEEHLKHSQAYIEAINRQMPGRFNAAGFEVDARSSAYKAQQFAAEISE